MSIALNGDGIISGVSSITVGAGASVFSPAANTLALGTNGSERVRVDSSGNVGVNITDPGAPLDVLSNNAAEALYVRAWSGGTGQVHFRNNANDSTLFRISAESGETQLYTFGSSDLKLGTNSTERLRVLAAGGLTFNGDTAAANALDDYEEGLWSPRLVGSAGGEASAYNHRKAGYVKIGNLVHVYGYMSISNKGTISGNVRISDFPFATKNDTNYYHAPALGWYTAITGITAYGLGLDMAPGQTQHTIVYGNGTGVSSLFVGNINSNFGVEWAFTYRTS